MSAGRSASSPTCRDRSSASAPSPSGAIDADARPDASSSIRIRRPATPSASSCRIRRSSPRWSPATACSSTTARCGSASPRRRAPSATSTSVEVGTALSDRKGVSVPDSTIDFGALTAKDRSDLEAALNAGVDWIALSFVQRPEDLAEVKKIARGRAGVLAKIEKPQAVERLAAIIEHADALMVARGDLGVEMPLERVPGIQKQITRAARRAGKPVVVATQMLESMITAPVPTRAEVSDVATAVFEGADAIMLSAESASGDYPVEAVATMDRIATEVERDPNYRNIMHAQRTEPEATGADAISAAARQIAETLNLAAICCFTASGTTAMRAARERPQTPIIALSPVVAHGAPRCRWSGACTASSARSRHDLEGMIDHACRIALREGFAKPGERIIVTAGVPLGTPGATNMLRIAFVGKDGAASRMTDVFRAGISGLKVRQAVALGFLRRARRVPRGHCRGADRPRAPAGRRRWRACRRRVASHDDAEAAQGAEMARLERQRLADVGDRSRVVVEQEIDGRPLVPALGVVGPAA